MSTLTIELPDEKMASLQRAANARDQEVEAYVLEIVLNLSSSSESAKPKLSPRQPGSAQGKVWMAPDFDEPLEDFKDYM